MKNSTSGPLALPALHMKRRLQTEDLYGLNILICLGGGASFVLALFSSSWGDHSLARYLSIYLGIYPSIVSTTSSYLPIYLSLPIYLPTYLPTLPNKSHHSEIPNPRLISSPFFLARTHAWFRRFLDRYPCNNNDNDNVRLSLLYRYTAVGLGRGGGC